MTRSSSRLPKSASTPQDATASVTWADWFWQFQAFQLCAMRDTLSVYNRCLASLASARDPQAAGAASQWALREWVACIDGVQHEWLDLWTSMPADALAAAGWRLRPGVRRAEAREAHEGGPDLFEQSRLGVEMLLRPWMPAPDLDHTDEFVA